MSKAEFSIKVVDKAAAESILNTYHYLKDISKGFKSGYNYGLFHNERLVGVCIYSGFPVPELAKGCYGLERHEQEGLFELSRLCIVPDIQSSEHNLASWFVSRTIRELRKTTKVRAVLSYADNEFHSGTVYKACNFKYYGLSAPKKDFWFRREDGSYIKHTRGSVKGKQGEWRPRSRKHRFLLTFDKNLNCLWEQKQYM